MRNQAIQPDFIVFNPARKKESGKQRFGKGSQVVDRVYGGFDASGIDYRTAQRISKDLAPSFRDQVNRGREVAGSNALGKEG